MAEISLSNVSSGGGSTSPGGANTNVQYNDSGSFAGDALFVFDEDTTRLGVGVTTPDTTLNIEGPDQCVARFESTGVGGGIDLKDRSTTANNYVGVGALGNNLCFRAGGVAQGLARLFSTGNLVIGSTLSDNGFQVETEDRDASFNGVRVGRGAGNQSLNTVSGFEALNSNVSGTGLTAIGYRALRASTGNDQTAIGDDALLLSTGNNNTAIGSGAASGLVSGNGNVIIGANSAPLLNNSGTNTLIGASISFAASALSNNVVIGNAAINNGTGSSNVTIGQSASNATFSECVILGRSATATANNQFVVGSTTYIAGAVTPGVLAQTHSWRVKINGTDYNILLNL